MINYQHLRTLVSSPNFSDELLNYQYQNCSNPQEIKVWNAITGHFEVRKQMPCGKCFHCCQAKIAEWVTRMFLHNQFNPYRYFITLTYSPIYGAMTFADKVRDIEFKDTLPVWDACNTHHVYAKHPSILCRSHLRNYFKRLRVLLNGQDISLFAVGEYGKKYSRCHYHAIVWSKSPISSKTFRAAWGKKYCAVNGVIKPYRGQTQNLTECPCFVSFGDVDVVDLLRPRFKSPHGNTTSDVFKYVAKYVNKYTDFDAELPNFANSTLQNEKKAPEDVIFGIKSLRMSKILRTFAPEILKARYYYECKCINEFNPNALQDLSSAPTPRVPFTRCSFAKRFAPFSVSSCKNAIGSEFLAANFESLAEGCMRPSTPDGVASRFPSYYRRKIAEHRCNIRCAKSTIDVYQNATHKSRISVCLANYKALNECALAWFRNKDDVQTRFEIGRTIERIGRYYGKFADRYQYETECCLYDYRTKRYLKYNPLGDNFAAYKMQNYALQLVEFCDALPVFRDIAAGFKFIKEQKDAGDVFRNAERDALHSIEDALGRETFRNLWLAANDNLIRNIRMHQSIYHNKRKAYTIDI